MEIPPGIQESVKKRKMIMRPQAVPRTEQLFRRRKNIHEWDSREIKVGHHYYIPTEKKKTYLNVDKRCVNNNEEFVNYIIYEY